MTRSDILKCHHEPFGDAFYFGPERISPAWLRWPADKIEKTGKAHFTYDYVLKSLRVPVMVIAAFADTATAYREEGRKRVRQTRIPERHFVSYHSSLSFYGCHSSVAPVSVRHPRKP